MRAGYADRMRSAWDRFWRWYQRHYLATLVLTTGVFLLQLFHLYWLFTDVIVAKLTGHSAFAFPRAGMFVYVLADYLEIPALVAATLLYAYELRKGLAPRAVLYIVLLNTQWIHMFWITDQVVVDTFAGHGLLAWNGVVAWAAILIDYLEVPVIVDTLRKVVRQRHLLWARARRNLGRGRRADAGVASPGTTARRRLRADARLAGE